MTTQSDPQPRESFRLSQLIYDQRYRSLTIQVVTFLLLLAGIGWLISNVVYNLAQLGRDFDFGFLGQRAGYDINQTLIAYSSADSHLRAAVVGVLNTLLIAVMGIALATVIGVLAGVLRLSKNWLVSQLMGVYVEAFRNIPLLLWILLIFAIMSESMPQPSAFREGGAASMWLFDTIAVTNRGIYVPRPVAGEGALVLLAVFLASLAAIWGWRRYAAVRQTRTGEILPVFRVSLALFFVPALLVYLAIMVAGGRAPQALIAQGATTGQSVAEFAETEGPLTACLVPGTTQALRLQSRLRAEDIRFRAVPVEDVAAGEAEFNAGACNLISLPAATAGSAIADGTLTGAPAALEETTRRGNALEIERPFLGGFNFEGGIHLRNSLVALWLALSLYTGAFIAEIVRGGILSVSKGQSEAAAALGLRSNRIMQLVVLPQALRVIVPPLISQYLNLTKNSSLAIAVGYMDVRSTLGGITINQTGRELEGMLLVGAFYLILSLFIAWAMNLFNASVKLKER